MDTACNSPTSSSSSPTPQSPSRAKRPYQSICSDSGGELVELYTQGDVILVVCDDKTEKEMRFLVSSDLLRVASPYFAALFGRSFKEGGLVQKRTRPEITLHEDDLKAMEIMLSLLHYRGFCDYRDLNLETLALVARQSDKYRCNDALRCWISLWFSSIDWPLTHVKQALFLTASHLFEWVCPAEIISSFLGCLPTNFELVWSSHHVLKLMPQYIIDTLSEKLLEIKAAIAQKIVQVGLSLRQGRKFHVYKSKVICQCGRSFDPKPKRCYYCGNCFMDQENCTAHVRFSEYFGFMSRKGLWPVLNHDQTVYEIQDKVNKLASESVHSCGAGPKCQLRVQAKRLSVFVASSIAGMTISTTGEMIECKRK